MLVESQPAFVLHSRKYTDSRILVEFLTREYGRIAGVVRPPRSKKQAGSVLAYTPYLISWRGNGQLKTVTSLEVGAAALQLSGKRLYCGFYLNELLLRALAVEDPCETMFECYKKSIVELSHLGEVKGEDLGIERAAEHSELEKILRNFELDLVQDLGFGLNFDFDTQQQEILPGAQDIYRLVDGEHFSPIHNGKENVLNYYFSGASLRAIRERNFDNAQTLKAAKILCRKALLPLIGERPLQSREFFK